VVGLAVLDFTCFVALWVTGEIARSQFAVKPAEQVMPSVSQPVAAMVAVIDLAQCNGPMIGVLMTG
jgi:hypothetical protein